ncbi:uncharacterized protein LOC141836002 [Curcuma longa]|uniref:uncharacterized protein LOC141836002 n=1 Tax=Curcuma longa TaxID=136217 RepID=UPI003D9F64EE
MLQVSHKASYSCKVSPKASRCGTVSRKASHDCRISREASCGRMVAHEASHSRRASRDLKASTKLTFMANIKRFRTDNGRIISTKSKVLTSDGGQFPYDYLVIATGHSVSWPQSRRERIDKFREAHAKMKNSSSVLIIGGGPSGVELASDIAASYPEKKVTLVHSGPRLLGFIGSKVDSKALEWLRSKNVDVLLEQTIDLDTLQEDKEVYITSVGEAIAADVHYLCMRRPLGSAWLKESVVKDCLDKYEQLMVDEHLRLKGFNNIFAIGDIIDVPVTKTGVLAQRHAMIVIKNEYDFKDIRRTMVIKDSHA